MTRALCTRKPERLPATTLFFCTRTPCVRLSLRELFFCLFAFSRRTRARAAGGNGTAAAPPNPPTRAQLRRAPRAQGARARAARPWGMAGRSRRRDTARRSLHRARGDARAGAARAADATRRPRAQAHTAAPPPPALSLRPNEQRPPLTRAHRTRKPRAPHARPPPSTRGHALRCRHAQAIPPLPLPHLRPPHNVNNAPLLGAPAPSHRRRRVVAPLPEHHRTGASR